MARPSCVRAVRGERSRIGDGRDLFQQPPLLVGQPTAGFDEVRAVAQACGAAPGRGASGRPWPWSPDRSTSGTSHPRNVGRAGVLRLLQQPVGAEALAHGRLVVAHDTGQQPGDRLDDEAGGDLASAEHVRRRPTARRRRGARGRGGRRPRSGRTAGRTRRRRPARAAIAWSKRRPPGPSSSSGRGGAAASTLAKIGSGRITMPAPPPNGASSTVRCTSVVWSRRSWQAQVDQARWRALPSRLSEQKPSTSAGKIVKTSIRMSPTG